MVELTPEQKKNAKKFLEEQEKATRDKAANEKAAELCRKECY